MIRIQRPANVPAVLATRGRAARKKHEAAVLADPPAYRSGAKKLSVSSSIYGHLDVKAALKVAQSGKCAFCEARVDHVAHGDVEHFRPKKGYRQTASDSLGLPGYYWLAYEWSNLLFSCQICNQRHKGNLFPLQTPRIARGITATQWIARTPCSSIRRPMTRKRISAFSRRLPLARPIEVKRQSTPLASTGSPSRKRDEAF